MAVFTQHTDAVVTVCNQRLYLLAQLKRQELDLSALDSVFNAIIANKILYVLPLYYGYLTQGHKETWQRIFKRANRRGFTVREYDLEVLAENAQYDLFHCSTENCLNHLYTANRKPAGSMQLRHRGHNFALATIHLEFNKRHFVALEYCLTAFDVCHTFVL